MKSSERHKKKGHRRDPTFVNLKSNTMKNTMQRYYFFDPKTNNS